MEKAAQLASLFPHFSQYTEPDAFSAPHCKQRASCFCDNVPDAL